MKKPNDDAHCAATGCRRNLTEDGGGLLCQIHLGLVRDGGKVEPRPGLSTDEAQAFDALLHHERPGRWYSGLMGNPAIALFIAPLLLLPMELLRMEGLGIPSAVRFDTTDTFILLANNLLPVMLFLGVLWVLYVVVIFGAGVRLMPLVGVTLIYLAADLVLAIVALSGSLLLLSLLPFWIARDLFDRSRARGALSEVPGRSAGSRSIAAFRAFDTFLKRQSAAIQHAFLRGWSSANSLSRDGRRNLLWALTSRSARGGRVVALRVGLALLLALTVMGLARLQGVRTSQQIARIAHVGDCEMTTPGVIATSLRDLTGSDLVGRIAGTFDWPVSCGKLVLATGHPIAESGLRSDSDHDGGAPGTRQSVMTEKVFHIGNFGDWAVLAPARKANLRIQVRRSAIVEFVPDGTPPARVFAPEPQVPPATDERKGPALSLQQIVALPNFSIVLNPRLAELDDQTYADSLATLERIATDLSETAQLLARGPAVSVRSEPSRTWSGQVSEFGAQGFDVGACLSRAPDLMVDFAEGSSRLDSASAANLLRDFKMRGGQNEASPPLVLAVGGASDTGPARHNDRLSERRAEHVKRRLAIGILGLRADADSHSVAHALARSDLQIAALGRGERPDRNPSDRRFSGRAVEIFLCARDNGGADDEGVMAIGPRLDERG